MMPIRCLYNSLSSLNVHLQTIKENNVFDDDVATVLECGTSCAGVEVFYCDFVFFFMILIMNY